MSDEKAKSIGKVLGTEAEEKELSERAKEAGLSKSNYLRRLLGWELNQTYAPEGNTRALGNSGRWRKGGKVAAKVKQYE